MLKIVLLTILASVIYPGLASIGDRSMDYSYCLNYCIQKNCSNNPARRDSLPWHLCLFLWTCGDDCHYSCMHQVTNEDVKTKRPIRQFYGKVLNWMRNIFAFRLYIFQWPFVRLLGIQEPASVAFSILNLATHLYGFSNLHQKVPKDYPYWWIVRLSPLVCIIQCLMSCELYTSVLM